MNIIIVHNFFWQKSEYSINPVYSKYCTGDAEHTILSKAMETLVLS